MTFKICPICNKVTSWNSYFASYECKSCGWIFTENVPIRKEDSKMTYREMAVETVKIAGQELIDRAEELVCNTKNVKDIDIWIRIPSASDDPNMIPEIQVSTNVYPSRIGLDKILNLRNRKDD